MIERNLNVGFSGGEKKKNEILQMLVLNPKLAILDETDSGLDVDAIRTVSKGIEMFKNKKNAVLIITHNTKILHSLKPDFVHVLVDGKKVDIPSYRLKAGQTISLKEGSKDLKIVKEALEKKLSRAEYLEFDADKQIGKLVRIPDRNEFLPEINEQLIVEFYNRG